MENKEKEMIIDTLMRELEAELQYSNNMNEFATSLATVIENYIVENYTGIQRLVFIDDLKAMMEEYL